MNESKQNKETQVKNKKLPHIIGIKESLQESIAREDEDFEQRVSKD